MLDATYVTINGVLIEMERQRTRIQTAQDGTLSFHHEMLEQFLLDTNKRFEGVMTIVRELQKNVNQLTPAGIRERIQEIISVDPLIPKADRFEQELKELEKTLRENEVSS